MSTKNLFSKQLRQLMPKVDKAADREKRFRDYLLANSPANAMSESNALDLVAERMSTWRKSGIEPFRFECMMGALGFGSFSAWWEMKVSNVRSQAAKKRNGSKAETGAVTGKLRKEALDTRK